MRANKYHAKKTTIDNITFASKAESRRYSELKLLQRMGDIRGLELQPRFDIVVNGKKCGFYKADFAYFRGNKRMVEDVKGFKTPLYSFKKKIVQALFSIQIKEM